jgi:hypothetical protein
MLHVRMTLCVSVLTLAAGLTVISAPMSIARTREQDGRVGRKNGSTHDLTGGVATKAVGGADPI